MSLYIHILAFKGCIKMTDTGEENWEQRQGKYSLFTLCHFALFELVTLQMQIKYAFLNLFLKLLNLKKKKGV